MGRTEFRALWRLLRASIGAAVQRLLRAIEAMPVAPAVLVITHDAELTSWADRVVRIDAGMAQAQPAIARRA